MDENKSKGKSDILKITELLENAGFKVLGVNYSNNNILEPIIVNIGNPELTK
jgi:hypothetical protein